MATTQVEAARAEEFAVRALQVLEHPLRPALYTALIFYCLTVSLAGGGPGLEVARKR